MFVRTFRLEHFLRSVYGTAPFLEYCRQREIAFAQVPAAPMRGEDSKRWTAALAQLPGEQQRQVEQELATVNELADLAAVPHFLEALAGQALPPDTIASGAPLALWVFLHHPDVFEDVLCHAEMPDRDPWHQAKAPAGVVMDDLPRKAAVLEELVMAFFRARKASGRFGRVSIWQRQQGWCFCMQVAGRRRSQECFTDSGEYTLQALWPVFALTFVYYTDGTLMLQSCLRSQGPLQELFQLFGRAVLGIELPESCRADTYDLDRLKQPFQPLADAADMELIRIRSLHLRYPGRSGRQEVHLKTLSSDERPAIGQLLRAHVPSDYLRSQLHVSYAELHIRLRTGDRQRSVLVRLWPNGSNLSPSPMGERMRLCLKSWDLSYVR